MFDELSSPPPVTRRAVHSFPPKLELLFKPARYKVLYGGRGGGKSQSIARALLLLGAQKKHRILCCREFQNSIRDSVHKLLSDQIEALGLAAHYDIQQTVIRGANGTEFMFEGLRHNATKLKSTEGITIVWVEEAQFVTKGSWEILIPTIRAEGSEIWMSLNPDMDTDETYKRFIMSPPEGAAVQKINWSDNPWFPSVLRTEMEHLKKRDYDAYMNVWEGHCRHAVEGAIYARELRDAMEDGRITKVPVDKTRPVHTFWDIGWSDLTAILFVQFYPYEFRVVDYHADRHKTVADYLKLLQDKGYLYGVDWLPHDAKAKDIKSGTSVEALMQAANRRVQIVPNLSIQDGINAARTIFPRVAFDEAKCADFLQTLRHYKYKISPDTGQYSKLPEHDVASHGADALRMFAVASSIDPRPANARPVKRRTIVWQR